MSMTVIRLSVPDVCGSHRNFMQHWISLVQLGLWSCREAHWLRGMFLLPHCHLPIAEMMPSVARLDDCTDKSMRLLPAFALGCADGHMTASPSTRVVWSVNLLAHGRGVSADRDVSGIGRSELLCLPSYRSREKAETSLDSSATGSRPSPQHVPSRSRKRVHLEEGRCRGSREVHRWHRWCAASACVEDRRAIGALTTSGNGPESGPGEYRSIFRRHLLTHHVSLRMHGCTSTTSSHDLGGSLCPRGLQRQRDGIQT